MVDGKLTGVPVEQAVDLNRIEKAVREILIAVGENPDRAGLQRTPARVARAYAELFAGLRVDPTQVLTTAFEADHEELVLVRDIEVFSLCVPSKQLVNVVGGARPARSVELGDQLWTLVDGEVRPTTVVDIRVRKTRELVEVETERGTVRVTPDHPFATAEGWVEAKDLAGHVVEWTHPRKLCRERFLPPEESYELGYTIGAVCADGTVAKRYLSLVVNEHDFALRFAGSMRDAFVGGDAHHMRQRFPQVALRDRDTFHGVLDGYVDGDGFVSKRSNGRFVVSGNTPFLAELAKAVGARFTPSKYAASKLYIADSWERRHGFRQEDHRTTLYESEWAPVLRVTPVSADGRKPFTVYSFTCEPYPTFLVGGHLTHNCEHHLLPFRGVAHIAYIPGPHGRITGLSKLARLVEVFARRPQVQERLTSQIADLLMQRLEPRGVVAILDCEHMCMAMRGIQKAGSRTVTSAVRGIFQRDAKSRAEVMSLIIRG